MFRVSQEELRTVLQQLDSAIRNHEEWFNTLNRQMLCRLPYNQRDVGENAHRQCLFGQWLYQHAHPKFLEHPAFATIEREHHRMHSAAAKALLKIAETGSALPEDYDLFSGSLQRLRLEIQTLKRELETAFYNTDSLTGANTRIGMLTHLSEQLELHKRGIQKLCVALMDFDHFKSINDRFGHLVGDLVLAGVTRHVLDNMRPYDRLFRFGGEEFLLSISHTGAGEAMSMIERLRQGIERCDLIPGSTDTPQVTVSFGVFEATTGVSAEQAIQYADDALYQAKLLGRNRAVLWTPELTADRPEATH